MSPSACRGAARQPLRAAILPRGARTTSQTSDEEAAAAVIRRQAQQKPAGGWVRQTRPLGAEVIDTPAPGGKQRVHRIHGLESRQSADRVGERAAGTHAARGLTEQPALQLRQAGNVRLSLIHI